MMKRILPIATAAAFLLASLPASIAHAGGGWHGRGGYGNCRGGGDDDEWAIAAGVVGGLFGIAAIAEAMRDPEPAPAVVYQAPPPPVVYQAPAVPPPAVVVPAPAAVVVPAPAAVVIPTPVVYAAPRPVYYYGGPPRPWGPPGIRIRGGWGHW